MFVEMRKRELEQRIERDQKALKELIEAVEKDKKAAEEKKAAEIKAAEEKAKGLLPVGTEVWIKAMIEQVDSKDRRCTYMVKISGCPSMWVWNSDLMVMVTAKP